MKSKVLFSALLGGFVLASCTADETLVSAPGSSQESPIKFSVSLDNDALTKADVTSDMKVNFEAGDLMSLFHGISNPAADLTGYQNAIYEGSAQDGEAFQFTTKSMVQAGGAIMVYPADTTFANGGSAAPVITIPTEQNARTKELTPHMSEVLQIDGYNPDSNEGTAGYGKYYGIVLKRVGTTLKLTADLQNTNAINSLDVEPLKVTSMELNATDGGNDAFTTAISIKYGTNAVSSTIKEEYPIWSQQSEVDLTNVPSPLPVGVTSAKAGTLTTTDVTDNAAIFTLLPQMTSVEADDASVVVNTNYGKVTLDDDTETVWSGGSDGEVTVLDGIKYILAHTLTTAPATSVFAGQQVAGYGQREIAVDVNDLDMDGLHITDENHLLDALTVYDAVANNVPVKWILDGNEDGEFVMHAEAAAAYEARVADEDNDIYFVRNREAGSDKVCTAVRLVAAEGTTTEVPAVLKFEGQNVPVPPTVTTGRVADDKVSIILEGAWTYSANKALTLVRDITVDEESSLQISGTVGATLTNCANFSIINNGAMRVSGTTDLALNLTNNGSITIPRDGQLFVAGTSTTLTNDATSLTEYGTISNAGNLGVRANAASAVINNYGYIKQENVDAYTYVTNNATTSASFASAFNASSNKMGTIELYGTGNVNTTVAGNQGFIKVITNAATVGNAEVGTLANYVVITGACSTYNATAANVEYVEVQSSQRVVFAAGSAATTTYSLTGLVVDANYSINIPTGVTVSINDGGTGGTPAGSTYLKGYIYHAGTFTCSDYDGYFGTTNSNNVIYQGQ